MGTSAISSIMNRIFNPAVGGEEEPVSVVREKLKHVQTTVPKSTVELMKYHGTDHLITDKNGMTYFFRDGKKIKVALPPDDVTDRYIKANYNILDRTGNLVPRATTKPKVSDYVNNLKFGF